MGNNESLGFVETMGLVAAIEAADAMVKAARVRVKTVGNADGGLLSVICEGDLASCKAAVDAGKTAAERVGEFVRSNVIPRPDGDTEHLVTEHIEGITEAKVAPPKRQAGRKDGEGKEKN